MSEVNQQVIADRLGLSRATVSRCFTNHPGISAVTRAKVFQLAAEIGYTHLESRSPSVRKKKKQASFSVLICSETEEYFREDYESPGEEILAGVSEYAQVNDILIEVHFISPNATDLSDPDFQKIDGLKDRSGRGILLIYPFPPTVIAQLAKRFPVVSTVDQVQTAGIDCVDVNHYDGISRAIENLVAAGHERIGFYTKDYPIAATWSYRRHSAFIQKMARLERAVLPEDLIGIFPRAFGSTEAGIEEVIKRTKQGVTAWVCAADHQAYDLIDAFEKKGLSVPEDVSITGFDGIQQDKNSPTLNTLEIPFRSIGTTGAERLAARVHKRFGGTQHVYISGKFRKGKTVAPRA
ncbi:MAG: LacI family DNA-binding transcriptional regulator [Akkermansiaceae bacterium]|jgi:DNA-binding LacI/PurR family transcriptional regulator|nr:LacI family DNA-binding transcriptional regulator [Akkermansiaceae bacterium]